MMSWCKVKIKINLAIDAIMLILMMAIAGLGFLIKFILVPGYKRNMLYEGDVELYFMGLTRHEWGSIHLWLAFLFLTLLMLHILLHWEMIICIYRKIITGKTARAVIAVLTGIIALFLALAPFFVKPEIALLQVKHAHRQAEGIVEGMLPAKGHDQEQGHAVNKAEFEKLHKSLNASRHEEKYEEMEVYGYMTLEDVAQQYAIPVFKLTEVLNIPAGQTGDKIGRLKRRYGFEMEELKDILIKIQDQQIKTE